MADAATITPTDTPAAAPPAAPVSALPLANDTKISLRDLRAAKEKQTAAPADAVAAPADDDVIDDATAAEIDTLEKPVENETPQSRSARRRKHQAAARKALQTRTSNERDDARGKLTEAERELAEWRAGRRTAQAAPPAAAATATAAKPKPVLEDFPLEQFKAASDPYAAQAAALTEALIDWKDEQRTHAATETRRREQADEAAKTRLTSHGTREADARVRLPDYDAVLQAASFPKTPATVDLLDLALGSDISADVIYHLAHPTNRAETLRLLAAPNQAWLESAFREIEASVSAALAPKAAPVPPKVIAAVEPTQPVSASAASGGLLRNPLADTGTRISLREIRAHRQAQGR